jgi:polysaccharide biosynthesis protein PslG
MMRWRLFLVVSVLLLALPAGARGQEAATTLDDEETSLESPFRYDGWFDAGFSYFYDPPAEVPTCGPMPTADGEATMDATLEAGLVIGEAICLDGSTAAADGSGAVEANVVADSYTTADTTSFDQTSAEALAYEESLAEPLPPEEATADVPMLEDPAVQQTRSPRRGFNTTQQVFWSDADVDRALDEMAASRSSVHRLTVFWAIVQPNGQTEFRWEAYDKVISRAAARGLRLILNPVGSPNWARNANRRTDPYGTFGMFAYPDNVTAWRTFIRQLATRYNPEGFEIWNEQNSRAFWDPTPTRTGPNPARWTTLFCGAAAAIRALRPAETVGMGGLAPHRTTRRDAFGIRNLRASDFVRRAYIAGAGRCSGGMTFVGYHPYVINRYCIGRDQTLASTPGILELRSVRGVMVARGHGARTIWITEWGFPSQTFRESATMLCRYSEARQAEMVRREHNYLRQLAYTRFSIYFNIKDAPADPLADAFVSIGMLRVSPDWSRKPSFTVWTGLP